LAAPSGEAAVTLSRFVYKSHKWLSVAVGLFTVLWFLSGIVMVLPSSVFQRGENSPPPAAPRSAAGMSFRDVQISVPVAIAAAERSAGHPLEIISVTFRRLLGRLVYVLVDGDASTHLVDASSGALVEITEGSARKIAAAALDGQTGLQAVSLLQRHDWNYKSGPLPAYRVVVNDPVKSILYISAETGEVQFTSRLGRLRAFIVDTHTFGFLQPYVTDRWTQWLLVLFAGVGFLLSLFGGWILWLQLDNWWRLRRRAA
jgi:hypothetical protein